MATATVTIMRLTAAPDYDNPKALLLSSGFLMDWQLEEGAQIER